MLFPWMLLLLLLLHQSTPRQWGCSKRDDISTCWWTVIATISSLNASVLSRGQCKSENFTPPPDVFWNLFFSKTEKNCYARFYTHLLRSHLLQTTKLHLTICNFYKVMPITQRIFTFHLRSTCPDFIANASMHAFRPAVDILNIRYELFQEIFSLNSVSCFRSCNSPVLICVF